MQWCFCTAAAELNERDRTVPQRSTDFQKLFEERTACFREVSVCVLVSRYQIVFFCMEEARRRETHLPIPNILPHTARHQVEVQERMFQAIHIQALVPIQLSQRLLILGLLGLLLESPPCELRQKHVHGIVAQRENIDAEVRCGDAKEEDGQGIDFRVQGKDACGSGIWLPWSQPREKFP
jgi:hypothetical protein